MAEVAEKAPEIKPIPGAGQGSVVEVPQASVPTEPKAPQPRPETPLAPKYDLPNTTD